MRKILFYLILISFLIQENGFGSGGTYSLDEDLRNLINECFGENIPENIPLQDQPHPEEAIHIMDSVKKEKKQTKLRNRNKKNEINNFCHKKYHPIYTLITKDEILPFEERFHDLYDMIRKYLSLENPPTSNIGYKMLWDFLAKGKRSLLKRHQTTQKLFNELCKMRPVSEFQASKTLLQEFHENCFYKHNIEMRKKIRYFREIGLTIEDMMCVKSSFDIYLQHMQTYKEIIDGIISFMDQNKTFPIH